MSKTYLFYDIETTGLNKTFDQVLHFAAIRTDLQLNEINRYEIKIKLNPDVIPSPRAILTHKISIEDMQKGVSEYTAIQQIHQWLNEPGTISLGYNSLNFDDEFLRFSFYRNLLPPYTHQYANQCGRMDIYPITVMFYLFKNEVIQWPMRDRKISLRLEDLNTQNQLASGPSHNAMTDVEMTLALAHYFFQERDMWEYLQNYFSKSADQKRMVDLGSKQAILVEGALGYEQHFQSAVYSLGLHQHYKNQSLWLRLDTHEFEKTPPDELIKQSWVQNKKLGEPGFILPFRDRFLQYLSETRLALIEKNKAWLQKEPAQLEKIINYYSNYTYPVFPETDPEASLYLNGFWSYEEENICRLFHQGSPKEKMNLIHKIQHPILSTLAFRIAAKNFPDLMTASDRNEFSDYLQKKEVYDYKGNKKLTRDLALQEISSIREEGELTAEQESLLNGLENYLNGASIPS